jgi:hypothetical protein
MENPESPFVPPPDLSPLTLRRGITRRPRSRARSAAVFVVLAAAGAGMFYLATGPLPRLGIPVPAEPTRASGAAVPGRVNRYPRENCRFALPEGPWRAEEGAAKQSLRALLVMRRSNPEAWLAVLAKDFKDRTPAEAELRDEAVRRLSAYFSEHLETEPADPGELGGRAAQRLVFRGQVHDVVLSGECSLLAHQGVGYWFLCWAPAAVVETAQPEFERLRGRFGLLQERDGWQGKGPVVNTFRGRKLDYTLRDTQDLWRQWQPVADFDPAADLALTAEDRSEPRDPEDKAKKIAATFVVLLLNEHPPDLEGALAAARANLERQQKVDYPRTTTELLPAKAAEKDGEPRVGGAPGRVVALDVRNGETRRRFVLLGVIRQAESLLVFQAECDWQARPTWEAEFTRLLNTFAPGK